MMRSLAFLSLFLCLSLKADVKALKFVEGCRIFDWQGRTLGQYPGNFCHFLADGSFISADYQSLKFFTKENQIKWEIPGGFHHQLKVSPDGQRILALGSTILVKEGVKYRADKFYVITVMGKILHEQTADVVFAQAKIPWIGWHAPRWAQDKEASLKNEMSHFNSIYEIPPMKSDKSITLFSAGDIIINSLIAGGFVLSADLKTVKHMIKLNEFSHNHSVHDLQVLSNGHLLYFNNNSGNSDSENAYSTIDELDFAKKRLVFEFSSKPREMFHSRFAGGVTALDDDQLLFSGEMNGLYIYSRRHKKIISSSSAAHHILSTHRTIQDVKLLKYPAFLNSRGIH
jgi:hypothetical protein